MATPTTTSPRDRTTKQTLTEEEYVQSVDHIVQRDFFPYISELRKENLALDLGSWSSARVSADTPLGDILHVQGQSSTKPWSATVERESSLRSPSPPTELPTVTQHINLDAFQSQYDNEDNVSFTRLVEQDNRQRKKKYAWAYEAEAKAQSRRRIRHQERPHLPGNTLNVRGHITAVEDQLPSAESPDQTASPDAATHNRSSTAVLNEPWDYQARNPLMFPPTAPTDEHRSSPGISASKQIIHANTRFSESELRQQRMVQESEQWSDDDSDAEQLLVTPLVSTQRKVDSFQPNASPASTSGPWYHLPSTPRRELLAQRLAEGSTRPKGAGRLTPSILHSPRHSNVVKSQRDRLTRRLTLSPAAQALYQRTRHRVTPKPRG
ncbi:hypothetical protein IWQ62_003823 [Dispira parvispora]|uniref:Uncharacterized protein n=1 Tax=Dispira parvispora TaxID=1520584 RepID=A0A9W8ANM8_9FUNG|nr:hypothetical protein IWQ62_003823 [Dispira parvispora]